jgi:predicted GIY-YIG superfamily endonuclease
VIIIFGFAVAFGFGELPYIYGKTKYYNHSGMYALTCKTCKHTYVGQTSRDLKQRYQEHMRYIENNNPQSAFALHILNNRHEYGTIDKIMTLLKTIRHMPSLIPYKQFFIQAHHQQNKLIAEQNPAKHSPIIQLATDTTYTSRDYKSILLRQHTLCPH